MEQRMKSLTSITTVSPALKIALEMMMSEMSKMMATRLSTSLSLCAE
jgi:hypothetical protein